MYRCFYYYLNLCFDCIEREIYDDGEESESSSETDEEYIERDDIIVVPKEQITLVTAIL